VLTAALRAATGGFAARHCERKRGNPDDKAILTRVIPSFIEESPRFRTPSLSCFTPLCGVKKESGTALAVTKGNRRRSAPQRAASPPVIAPRLVGTERSVVGVRATHDVAI